MIFDIDDTTHSVRMKLVQLFKYIKDPPDYLIKLAILHREENIQFLKDKEKWVFHIIKKNPYTIKDINCPSKEAQLYALSFILEENYFIFTQNIDFPCKEVLFQDTLYCLKLKVWAKMNYPKLARSGKKLVLE